MASTKLEQQKLQFTNRYGLKIVLVHTAVPGSRRLAFIQHGMSGFKEEPHILAMAAAFHRCGISTINFDATCSFGESGGDLRNITLTSHCNDLEDVIVWATGQEWYVEPFYLAGHSLGGASVLHYAYINPEKVAAIAPLSAVVSGAVFRANHPAEQLAEWQRLGMKKKVNSSAPGKEGYIGYQLLEDMDRYDLLLTASKASMPLLCIVGSRDTITTPQDQKRLFERWAGPKVYQEIAGAEHTFKTPQELEQLACFLDEWICRLGV